MTSCDPSVAIDGAGSGGLSSSRQLRNSGYTLPKETLGQRCLFDGELRLEVCLDWCINPIIEGAFLRWLVMAESVATNVSQTRSCVSVRSRNQNPFNSNL